MRRLFLSLSVFLLFAFPVFSGSGQKRGEAEILHRSGNGSYPMPFNLDGANPVNQPAISTGYYIVNSVDVASAPWRPNPATAYEPLDRDPQLWRRIVSGPNQYPSSFWTNHPEGKPYFRNPSNMNDSTDNAFAGPIPIKLATPFYFNGVRYDSFYVSTNGFIVLTNRRYFYDRNGNRYIPQGQTTAYDPNSDDPRSRSGDGLNDPTPDNYGYQYIALGAANGNGTATQGARNPNNVPFNNGLFNSWNAAIIAPFWDDLQLSVFNPDLNQPDDFAKVYYKRSPQGDKLIIYFVNITPRGLKATPFGIPVNFPADIRPFTDDPFVSANVQIILNSADSSITFVYENFQGVVTVGFRPVFSNWFFFMNSTIGVRGQARFPDGSRYTQYTMYSHNGTPYVVGGNLRSIDALLGRSNYAIKFKQWKNVLRVVDMKYFVRDPNTGQFTKEVEDPNNFELLVGDPMLGAIQPVGIFQNLSNDIQGSSGVNYQEQGLDFRVRFRISNDVINDTIVYNRQVCVDQDALELGYTHWDNLSYGARLIDEDGNPIDPTQTGVEGVPPYAFVEVKFPPFETNTYLPNHVGRLTATVIAEPKQCAGGSFGGYGDMWPFDDTVRVRLFGVKRLTSFYDNVNDFSVVRRLGPIPSANKWVSIDADVVDGNQATYNPPPPRGPAGSNPLFQINSPVIRLNRDRLDGSRVPRGGDQIISFPIDIRGKEGAVLAFSVERTGRPPANSFDRDWSAQTAVGPEHRVFYNGDPNRQWDRAPDELLVEFAKPSPDGYNNIVNIPENQWNVHPRLDDPGKTIKDNPAFTLFGGGGYRRGFSEVNPDSALTKDQGLRADLFDDGKDDHFQRVYIPLPDYLFNPTDYFDDGTYPDAGKYFRFRIRLNAQEHYGPPTPVSDDADNFYIDNVEIIPLLEVPDLEISYVKAKWPYTQAPASQCQRIPIEVKVYNNSSFAAQSFAVQVWIKRRNDPDNKRVYCRYISVPQLAPHSSVVLPMPVWNARLTTPGEYVISARVIYNLASGDAQPLNDSTYSIFNLVFGDSFAYDPVSGQNDAPQEAQIPGKGLNLLGTASGGYNTNTAFGVPVGSGNLAMKFRVLTQDTIYGYKAYFASLNQDLLNIRFQVYRDAGGAPGQVLAASRILRQRGRDDIRIVDCAFGCFDEYTDYVLPQPVILPPNTYWMSATQLGAEGYELGASKYRMGMVTTHYNTLPPGLGANGTSLLIHKEFRTFNRQGKLINDNVFAFENSAGSGTWIQFTPTIGNPAYAFLEHIGRIPPNSFFSARTYTRGTWVPMIRPYFGERSYATPPVYEDTTQCSIVPVELTTFRGMAKPEGIVLWWETASEINNAGFYVQRRVIDGDENCDCEGWEDIGFVPGAGNSSQVRRYEYVDREVVSGTTYEYRLRQVDFDGSQSYSNKVEITYQYTGLAILSPLQPNPFADNTIVKFTVPERQRVRIEIVDSYGKVVKRLVDEVREAGSEQMVIWDGRDEQGQLVASGLYFCKMTLENRETMVQPVHVVR